tara:strand:+ start:3801 stop:5153 length:1353 start_codon:yes stop_codon:yes gene_type:complete
MHVKDSTAEYYVGKYQFRTPIDYKKSDIGIIPADWEVDSLRAVIRDLKAGVSVKSICGDIDSLANESPAVLKTSCVQAGRFFPLEAKLIASKDLGRATTTPYADSILISRMNTISLVGESGYIVQDYPALYVPDRLWMTYIKSDVRLCVRWLSYVLSSDAYRIYLKSIATGTSGSMKNIAKKGFLDLRVAFPSYSEQCAISEALADVDGLLEALDRLIAKKRAIKKAAMQQLLTGETRLPGFDDDWYEIVLGDLGHWRGGLTPSMSKADYWLNGNLPWLTSSDIRQGYIGSVSGKITQVALSQTTVPVMPAGSIIVVIRSGILRRFFPVAKIEQPKAINQDLRALAPGPSHDPEYLKQALTYAQDELLQKCMKAGTTVESIDSHWFKKFSLKLPGLPEQRKISQLLSDMESEIAGLEKRRDKTQELKKGMMQQLLTGRTRLIKSDAPVAL